MWQNVGQQMVAIEDKCVEGIERRGKVYYLRWRVPKRYSAVEPRKEINRSLKTRDLADARAHLALAKRVLIADWDHQIAEARGETSIEAFDAAIELMRGMGLPYLPQQQILAAPVEKLLDRIEALESAPVNSARIPAVLGQLEFPSVNISEMPPIMAEVNQLQIAMKNDRQLDEWNNKYRHAAKCFCDVVGDKAILDISEQDAMKYHRHWLDRRDAWEVTTDYADKKLRFIKQLLQAYFIRFDVPQSQRKNPFEGLKIAKVTTEDVVAKKLSFPMPWVQHTLIEQAGMEDLNEEARYILTVAAECGCRQTEIYDLPPTAIKLDHEIPHVELALERDDRFKRELKNSASTRPVVLLGAALEAMKRHPTGFEQYRGKKSFSGTVNKYFRERNLFPILPENSGGKYTVGCTRHTFEDRMLHAKMSNEERAYLMGHSIGAVRGRPVYGSKPDLRIRALYQEMISFPTITWHPRPIKELRTQIDHLLAEQGFRVE